MREIIERGTLRRTIILDEEYEMVILDKTNIDEIVDLQDKIVKNLNNPEVFVMDSREFILNSVLEKGKGLAIGVYADNKLIAFRTVSFPGKSEINMGREIDIPLEELDHVAHLESTVVDFGYRGNRLQAKMMKHTFKILSELGYYHILCTVSPFNYPSLKNVMDADLIIKALSKRGGPYEGKWRFLLARDLRNTDTREYTCNVEIENNNLEKQQELLKKGFEGFSLCRNRYVSDEFIIHYGIPYKDHVTNIFE